MVSYFFLEGVQKRIKWRRERRRQKKRSIGINKEKIEEKLRLRRNRSGVVELKTDRYDANAPDVHHLMMML
jgi:hypothetical protein